MNMQAKRPAASTEKTRSDGLRWANLRNVMMHPKSAISCPNSTNEISVTLFPAIEISTYSSAVGTAAARTRRKYHLNGENVDFDAETDVAIAAD